jgi:hypothetical protein
MSRSRRHSPFCGITTARSEKADKRDANRRLRVRLRSAVARVASSDADAVPAWPELRDVSNIWIMAKDGKFRFNPARWPRLMRK